MKPDCKCFKDGELGEDNATIIGCVVEDAFSRMMVDRHMCPQSGYYVMLTTMVMIMRRVAGVDWREAQRNGKEIGDMSELELIEMDDAERAGFKGMLERLVGDLSIREEELQMKSLEADRDAAGLSS